MTKWPILELKSADDADKSIRIQAAVGNDAGDQPSERFFKRVSIVSNDQTCELFLDFEACRRLSEHLMTVVEIARGQGYGSGK